MSSHSYINPESVFAQTALEMVATHGPEDGASDDTMCDRCQQPLPCPPVRNAIPVLEAAGLPVYPAGSAEARRAAAESALGRTSGPPSGVTLPGSSGPSRPGLPEPSLSESLLPGLPEGVLPGLPEDALSGQPEKGSRGRPEGAEEPVEAAVGAPAAEGDGPAPPAGPPMWPDPSSVRAVA
ncbi:hypothetical protein [Catenuloplanes indicus]|uniref:Uncharacterized protein n=1 Tax=Catenuloplanes indicus TaxID=137267 RepID=A0AAE4B181_9ACTN|nr:hypothetical protein [Catenuloplanes indicus]MDQ0370352.1 hypothetical protein [Catenuloplanes indicus]